MFDVFIVRAFRWVIFDLLRYHNTSPSEPFQVWLKFNKNSKIVDHILENMVLPLNPMSNRFEISWNSGRISLRLHEVRIVRYS